MLRRTPSLSDSSATHTGGGTYARKLGGKGVAFGPNFKGDDIRMHNADESVDKENFLRHMQICFEAMYRMYTLE